MRRMLIGLALQTIQVLLFLQEKLFEPLEETTKRTILLKFLQTFVHPLYPFNTRFSNFACITTCGQNLIKFRPLVLSDLTLVFASTYKEPSVQRIFRPNQGEIVVDVGAHIGFYTLKAAKKVGPRGKVIAIEPDSQNFLLLKKNIAINHFGNVIAIHAALSDINGSRLFYNCINPVLSGFHSQDQKIRAAEIIETMTLDTLLQHLKINSIDWLKIDVEGEELSVLKGAKQTLYDNDVKIIIEAPPRTRNKIIRYLKKMDFHTRYLGDIYYFAFKD